MASTRAKGTLAVNGGTASLPILRETVNTVSQECPTRLGLTANEIQAKSPTLDVFFDTIAAERLRRMPPDGSRLDGALRRASRLAVAVGSLRDSVYSFMDGAEEATKLIWGTNLLFLEMGIDHIDILESLYGRYGRVTLGISLLLQQETFFPVSRPLQQQVAEIYAHLLELVVHVTSEYRQATRTQHWQTMTSAVDAAFFRYTNRFITHWRQIFAHVLESGTAKQHTTVDLPAIYQFLELQDRPLQMLLEGHSHSLADGSFTWFEPHLTTFAMGRRSMMMIRGNPGCGKSALAQWTVERLQASSEYDIWNVIPIVIRSDVPISTLTLSILKGILIQMLDHCVSSRKTQDAILAAVTGAMELATSGASDPQVEGQLWTAIRTAVQSNLHFMLVVDGFDQMKHAETTVSAFLGLLQDTVANTPSKLIIFSRPMSTDLLPIKETTSTHQIAMNTATTHQDLQEAVTDIMLSDSSFSGLEPSQRESLTTSIVNRSQGCFVWAQLAAEAVRHQTTYNEMTTAVHKMPNTLGDLIDYHLRNINLNRLGTQSLLAWLVASERPLRIPEVEQLLSVDLKSLKVSTRPPNVERDVFQPLGRLISVRDGFVSFRHPMVREHLQARAQMRQELPFSLADAHYDLLIRCLAWVRRSVSDEISVSWDKMSVEVRDRYLDAYVLLEYTARYWLSHMLSSPMASSDRELSFPSAFRRALPDTVLFAQLELTNRESQFSRSSIVELYRLAVGVRRVVLGSDSPAVLQSLILSARASEKARTSWANDHLYQAWTVSRSQLGTSSTITQELEQMLVSSPAAGRLTSGGGGKSVTLREMTMTGWGKSDISFPQRLQYLDRLVNMYQENNQNDEAYNVSKDFYRQTVKTYGAHSSETMQAAEFLTKNFDIAPSDELALELASIKYENMLRSMDATDPRRVTYSLYLAQLYEQNGQVSKSETVLSRLWTGLSAREADSKTSWDQKTKVAFYYSQFLRRRGQSDRATSILRELSADLEAEGGVKSPEMLKRAEELRGEAREMNLTDMDRALALEMWKYYQSSGQVYSSQAVSLAETLTEGMIPSQDATTAETEYIMAGMSPEDQELLPGWIDSLASAGDTRNMKSIMMLCHQLSTQCIREEEWRKGSDYSWAVLKHAWPDVEDAQTRAKFSSDLSPLMSSLALDYAYCIFRRLDVKRASIVYGNAFKASITADQVAVPAVTTVTKTVVEFYETTFQFDKALILLRQVSEFFASRLGAHDKHTLDSRYYEADLALRLDRRAEAEDSYRHIYKACVREGRISSSGVRAAVALANLYEQDKKWDAALDVYRHLWPTLVHFDEKDGYDRALQEGLLPKTYAGYMAILESTSGQAGYEERYQVASQHQQLCRKLYGATSHRTRDATMYLAALCASSDRHTSEAIDLYRQVLKTSDWVSATEASRSLPDMTQPLPMDIKHRMAQLHLRNKDTSQQARALYIEELALSKQQQGLSAPTTLMWLREIARLYSLQDNIESRRKGADLLNEHVDEVVHVTANQDALIYRARRLAEIYLECGYTTEGWALIDSLHQQVIHDTPAAQRKNLEEYRPAVFVASFEEVFGRTRSSSQILDDLSREGEVYNVFQQSLAGHDLMPTLAAGERLHRLQTEQKRSTAAQSTQNKLYDFFCNTLSVSQSARKKDAVYQFYSLCRRESLHDDYNLNIITQTTSMVRDLCNQSRFQEATDVTSVFHSFVHLTDGLRSTESIFIAIKLCLYLCGYQVNKCTETTTANAMSLESKTLLQEVMNNARDIPMEFSELPFEELNDLVTVLGEHEMFQDLEVILTDLWTSRIVQKTWTLPAVVWIGRRLVETRFCRGHVTAATTLGKDICYNLRQVWGNSDPVTLEMNKLLSGLYTASGNNLAAAALHETALAELLNDETKDQSAAINAVTQHLELLQRAQARLAKEGQSAAIDASAAQERVQQIATKFGLSSAKLEQPSTADDSLGMWERPRRFSLDVEEAAKHSNHLRQSSGSALLTGNAGAKRLSITAL
ncbi:NACHT domain protein [Aspergillus eucalypticola CBS 122712]|uniref:NACHT domain protein n=1 Tax=Aspergillus eucalypticola (strain CBS 122712 / IBT 29274) TaxID=1448314 RepID=A0A317USZ5_ASPEC|nr:NACHT domain protein [Aspergillus eucalypticola CBS 122712]PWY63637.1 NACHT domain protein [Aspergillus eucalypticola CBS 122712]